MDISKIKPYVLPVAMTVGALFHQWIGRAAPLMPYLIATMLFITYCRIDMRRVRLSHFSLWLVAVQVLGGVGLYFILRDFQSALAQAAMICVLCPVATAAPVVTSMLGGNIERVMVFSLVSNLVVAVVAPLMFAYIGASADVDFLSDLWTICTRVLPLLLLPLLTALLLQSALPKVAATVASHQSVSFYIWSVSLTIVVARAFSFILTAPASSVPLQIAIAAIALVTCLAQFYVGRRIGSRYGDAVAGAQSLGQKNTILSLWMSLTFLTPLSSVGPAAYIIWQNIINSVQIYRFTRNEQHI